MYKEINNLENNEQTNYQIVPTTNTEVREMIENKRKQDIIRNNKELIGELGIFGSFLWDMHKTVFNLEYYAKKHFLEKGYIYCNEDFERLANELKKKFAEDIKRLDALKAKAKEIENIIKL